MSLFVLSQLSRVSLSDTGMCLFVRRVRSFISNNTYVNIKAQRLVSIPVPTSQDTSPLPQSVPTCCGLFKSFRVTLISVFLLSCPIKPGHLYQPGKNSSSPTYFWLYSLLSVFWLSFEVALNPHWLQSLAPLERCLFIPSIFVYLTLSCFSIADFLSTPKPCLLYIYTLYIWMLFLS